jgi:hypothetical protein
MENPPICGRTAAICPQLGCDRLLGAEGADCRKRAGMQANWNEMAIWNREGASFMLIGEDFAFHIDLSSSHTCVQQP